MKIAIVTLIAALATGCGNLDLQPADAIKAAACIEQGVRCSMIVKDFFESSSTDVPGFWKAFNDCVICMVDMGCRKQAEELRNFVDRQMEDKDE